MSDSSGFEFHVLTENEMLVRFGAATVSALLQHVQVELLSPTADQKDFARSVKGTTRSEWFKIIFERFGRHIDLPFLSGEGFTYILLIDEDGKIVESDYQIPANLPFPAYASEFQYAAIHPSQMALLKEQTNQLWNWCLENTAEVAALMDQELEDVLDGLENASFSDAPNRTVKSGEDGDSPQFFFCVLFSIRELIEHAHRNGLFGVYVNMMYSPLEESLCRLRKLSAGR